VSDLTNQNFETLTPFYTKDGTAYSCSESKSKTIVFIHGLGMVGNIWKPQINFFSDRFQVVTYDLLGHGKSPLPPNDVSLDHYIEQLNELVTFLGISSFALIGHSMGAIISVAFTLKYPHKVKALVPISMVFNRSTESQLEALERANQVLKNKKITNVEHTLNRWFSKNKDNEEKGKIAKVKKWLESSNPQGYGLTYRLFALSDKVFLNKLSNLSCPVLYLTGDDDPNSTPEMSRRMAELTRQSEFSSVEDEAHMLPYIAAKKVNPIIENYLRNII